MTDVIGIPQIDVFVIEGEGTAVVETAVQGPPGPPGPPGPAGGSTYEHTQDIAASVWTIPHNLNRFPSITVTDHLGNLLAVDAKYLDSNIVQVTHGVPLTGYAYLN